MQLPTTKRIYFEKIVESKVSFRWTVIGSLYGLALIIIAIIKKSSNLAVFYVFMIMGLIAFGLVSQMIIRGDLKNIVITDEGIVSRKILKPNVFIRWENVDRAETAKMSSFDVIMIALEGYDEISKETKTIYVENRYVPRKLIKGYMNKK